MTKFQQDLIEALKAHRHSDIAKNIAERMGTDSRAVATGMRGLVKNGCVSWSFKKGLAYYRLVRVKPLPKKEGASHG